MLIWVMAEGQEGKVLRGQLRDADGAVDLDGFDAAPKAQVALSKGSALLVDLAVTPDADQTTEVFEGSNSVAGKGWFELVTETTMAELATRSAGYLLSFKALNAGDPVYFPLSRFEKRTYGKLIVQEPLG